MGAGTKSDDGKRMPVRHEIKITADYRIGRLIDLYLNNKSEDYSEDKKFFFSVQLGRYFTNKGKPWFNSRCEKDVVMQIVEDTWRELIMTRSLKVLKKEDKANLFSNYLIFFPQFCLQDENTRVVYARFR